MSRATAAPILALALLTAACAVGPNYHRPALSPSAGYGASATAGGEGLVLTPGADIPGQWWRVYHCAELDGLVARALARSSTIAAAQAALRSARELTRAQKGADYPSVTASLQPSHQAFAPDLATPLQNGASVYELTTTQVSVAYSPDLFGANRRQVESLAAQADQQRFELAAARVTLAANVVAAAVQDALLRAQIEETGRIIAGQEQVLASFQRQAALGQASQADLAAQRALLAQARAALPPLERQFRVNRDLLAALVGQTPAEPLEVRFTLDDLSLPADLPLSLPARLVEQRPDVRIAEEQLHAASAQVGVAVAARLPSLQIDGSAGSAALGLTPVFGQASDFWSIAGALTQPLFQGGTLLHRQKAAEAAYDQAAAQYRAAVVTAFQNTADVLHALWTDRDAWRAAAAARDAAGDSLRIARAQFGLGDVSRLALVGAEQADAQARLALLQADANRLADAAALFQALGGGWWNGEASAAPPAKSRPARAED